MNRLRFLPAWVLVGAVALAIVAGGRASAATSVRLADLDGRLIDPLESAHGASAVVVVFVSIDCPVSNRYAPDLQRLYERFAAEGVRFWVVYPNPAESVEAIRAHLADFGLPGHALRDPRQELATLAGATITPEAALFDAQGRLVYHGRIDDRYVSLGVERPAATRHDLRDALVATLAGRPVEPFSAPAVGCYISDFARL